MPIKESQVETGMIAPELGLFKVPVFYTDELMQTDITELAFSSVSGILPYLFAGYFTGDQGFQKWYFSNARRHEEMHQAIEQDLGRKLGYTYGQIWLNHAGIENGVWRFDRLILHSELPDKRRAEQQLRQVIRPQYLSKDFEIQQARY